MRLSHLRLRFTLPLLGASLLVLLVWPGGIHAQSTLEAASLGATDWPNPRKVELRSLLTTKVGHGCLATLPDEVERVAVADDSLARVQIISPREILLTGLSPGRTTVHIWLADGRRLRHILQIERDLDLLRQTLRDLDPRISVSASPDGRSVLLHGEVADESTSRAAQQRTSALLDASAGGGASVLNLLRHPGSTFSVVEQLARILQSIDPRIRVQRIQVGNEPNTATDTFVLEGRVATVEDMVRAVMLAERQLGGTGGRVRAANEDERLSADRFRRGLAGSLGGSLGGSRQSASGQVLAGSDPRSTSLPSQIARGQVITSDSGRVISLLKVDNLYQVLVSIRVMEVDRAKTRNAGINFRLDAEHVSIGNYTSVDSLPAGGSPPLVDAVAGGNLVAAFVDQTSAIVAAFDFLQTRNFGRSVAEPSLVTLSGELASVVVGGELPIPTTTANQVSTFQGFVFQDFGVRLDIRPTVTDGDMVALEVAPSIVNPTPGTGFGGVPGFTVQSVTTTARVQAGQSLLIGGLLAFTDGLEDRRVPGLGRLPLFRWKRKTRSERELLFLITPRLVRIDREMRADAVVDPTPDLNEIELPELRWPEDRTHWRDEFEPHELPADGIPDTFRLEEMDGEAPLLEVSDMDAATDPTSDYAAADYADNGPDHDWAAVSAATAPPAGRYQVDEWVKPCLNLRPGPGVWNRPLDCLAAGTGLELIGADNGWKQVRLDNGVEGWVAGLYLVAAEQ
jgi:pilus assembly protein CpaC